MIILPEYIDLTPSDYIVFPFRMFTLNVWTFIGLTLVLFYLAIRLPLLLHNSTAVLLAFIASEVKAMRTTKKHFSPHDDFVAAGADRFWRR